MGQVGVESLEASFFGIGVTEYGFIFNSKVWIFPPHTFLSIFFKKIPSFTVVFGIISLVYFVSFSSVTYYFPSKRGRGGKKKLAYIIVLAQKFITAISKDNNPFPMLFVKGKEILFSNIIASLDGRVEVLYCNSSIGGYKVVGIISNEENLAQWIKKV